MQAIRKEMLTRHMTSYVTINKHNGVIENIFPLNVFKHIFINSLSITMVTGRNCYTEDGALLITCQEFF
jgi:hypothetical protein